MTSLKVEAGVQLTPTEIFYRCYARMVRGVLNPDHPLLKKVQESKISAPAACIELFESAGFSSDGVLKNRTSKDAQQILKTFHSIHQEWFSTKLNMSSRSANYLIRDLEEPALYFTLAAFFPVIEFKSIVTLESGLQGIRDSATNTTDLASSRAFRIPSTMPYHGNPQLHLAYNEDTLLPLTVEEVAKGLTQPYKYNRPLKAYLISDVTEHGTLVGIKNARSIILPAFAGGFNLSSALAPDLKAVIESRRTNFEINAHLGGGIIGSQTFLLNNSNLPRQRLASGYDYINRRIPTKIFEDLMCHELPTLTSKDVEKEVFPTSPHTFQTSTSCMQCHSSMDGAALGLRNLYVFMTAPNPTIKQTIGLNADGFSRLPSAANAKTYALTPPIGRLHYRELLSKTLVSNSFTNLTELGQLIAQGNDIYTCSAKRYYQFFTGINVALNKKATSKRDRYHQDLVLKLGQKLKTTQSVKELLREIFASRTFSASSYNPSEAE